MTGFLSKRVKNIVKKKEKHMLVRCMYVCMYVCLYVWMDRWVGGLMDACMYVFFCMYGWVDGWVDECMYVCMYINPDGECFLKKI